MKNPAKYLIVEEFLALLGETPERAGVYDALWRLPKRDLTTVANVVRRRIEATEAVRDALRERIAQAEAQQLAVEEHYRTRLVEVEAQAAAMRGVLSNISCVLAEGCDTHGAWDAFCEECGEQVKAALASSAGREMLERMRRLEAERDALKARFAVPIVCMCGSTRFKQAWIAENARLTGEGYIVLSVGLWGYHERVMPSPEVKAKLDELHRRKIDLCDWVWVLDVGGYIGESTQSEIDYALSIGKPVRYLSREFPDYKEPVDEVLVERDALRSRLVGSEAQVVVMRASLERCGELFDEIRGDWTDPRSECREGQAIVAWALSDETGKLMLERIRLLEEAVGLVRGLGIDWDGCSGLQGSSLARLREILVELEK